MKKIIIVLIAFVLLLTVFFVWYFNTGESEYYEKETAFGKYGQEITLVFDDGTRESVKPISENEELTIYYNNKAVTSFYYTLYAKAKVMDGTTSSSVIDIDPSGFIIKIDTYSVSPITKVNTFSHGFTSAGITQINPDNVWTETGTCNYGIEKILPVSLSEGFYNVFFISDGTVKYRINTGSWMTGDFSSSIQLTFANVDDDTGTINVYFSGDASAQ